MELGKRRKPQIASDNLAGSTHGQDRLRLERRKDKLSRHSSPLPRRFRNPSSRGSQIARRRVVPRFSFGLTSFFRRSARNASSAGEIHLPLCQAANVRMVKSGPHQGKATSFRVVMSELATILGRQAIPIPRATHSLIVSTLVNSMTDLNELRPAPTTCSSLDRYAHPVSVKRNG